MILIYNVLNQLCNYTVVNNVLKYNLICNNVNE